MLRKPNKKYTPPKPTSSVKNILELRDPLITFLGDSPEETALLLRKLALCNPLIQNGLFRQLDQIELNHLGLTGLASDLSAERIALLLQHVVKGEEKEAQHMLGVAPGLLLNRRADVTDYSGRRIHKLTPFEAALAAGDTNMVEMMAPYFDQIENGREIMQWQIKQIFPDKKGESKIFPDAEGGLEGHLERQKKNVFDFSALTAAIDAAKNNPTELQDALNKIGARFTETIEAKGKPYDQLTLTEKLNCFREKFREKSYAEVVVNREHLLKAFTTYNKKFDGWNWDQRNLFWRQVIGFAQRFLPACDAQAFAQGLYSLIENNKPLLRSFRFDHGKSSFYPLDLNSCSNLGFDYVAQALVMAEGGAVCGGDWHRTVFTKFISSKKTRLEKLIQVKPAPAPVTPTWCVIL